MKLFGEIKKYGNFDLTGKDVEKNIIDQSHVVHKNLASREVGPGLYRVCLLHDPASISKMLRHLSWEFCPRCSIQIWSQNIESIVHGALSRSEASISTIVFFKRKKHEKIFSYSLGILSQRYFFCIITSQMIGYQVEGANYKWGLGKGTPGTGYPDPSNHKIRNIWQVSNLEGLNFTTLTVLTSWRFSLSLLLLHHNKSSCTMNNHTKAIWNWGGREVGPVLTQTMTTPMWKGGRSHPKPKLGYTKKLFFNPTKMIRNWGKLKVGPGVLRVAFFLSNLRTSPWN